MTSPPHELKAVLSTCPEPGQVFEVTPGVRWLRMALPFELNHINPQVAVRLARGLDRWKQFAPNYQVHMKSALEFISKQTNLSSDVAEVIQKALNS